MNSLEIIKKLYPFGRGKEKYRKHIFGCGTSSISALALDYIILIILVQRFGYYYLTSAVFSFLIAHSAEYYYNRNHVFKIKEIKWFRYLKFIFIEVVSIILLVLMMKTFVEFFNIHYLLSRLIVSIVIGVFGFLMNYIFTFEMLEKSKHL
ncbi:MAG: GtrA family protein [Nanoarchaeota archaeon]